MPKPTVFKTNSVVYFQGDNDDRVYILKSGKVALRSTDIETGEAINDLIQTGEFFGVKSALGRFAREEDAVVLSAAQVVQFSVSEFEQLISTNTRVIIKMLKVFSNQLRRIHSKVSSMLNQQDHVDPSEGMHSSALFYFQNRQYAHAEYIWKRYLDLYPDGRHVAEIRELLQRAGQSAQAQGSRPEISADLKKRPGADLDDVGTLFFEAESKLANEQFDEALDLFNKVLASGDNPEYQGKAEIGLGRCMFAKRDYAGTIQQFSRLIQESPRHPEVGEMLYFVGASYAESGKTDKAKAFLAKAQSSSDDAPLRRKIDRVLEKIG